MPSENSSPALGPPTSFSRSFTSTPSPSIPRYPSAAAVAESCDSFICRWLYFSISLTLLPLG